MKLKVGYFGIGRLTFDTRLAEKNFQLISKKINLKYKNSIGIEKIVYTETDVKNLIKFFKKNPCDYYIAIQTTFTDAKFIVEFSKIFSEKFLLLAIQENRTGERLRLNSICGLNLASHALQKNNFYPSLDILDLKKDLQKQIQIKLPRRKKVFLKSLKLEKRHNKQTNEIFKKINNQNLGLIGKRPEGFYTCDFNKSELKEKLKVNIKNISLSKLFDISKNLSNKELINTKNNTKKYISDLDKLNQKELNKSLSLYNGLKIIKSKNNLDNLAVRCWPETFTEYGCAICAPMAMMNEELVSSACEADVLGSVSCNILNKISNSPALLVDIVDVRKSDQTAVFWHCGLAPKSMADGKIKAGIHSNRLKPLLHEFALKAGDITIFRISKTRNKLIFFVQKAKILKRKKSFSGTSGVVTLGSNTYSKFKRLFESGIEHHLGFTYGNFEKEIKLLAGKLNIPVYTL